MINEKISQILVNYENESQAFNSLLQTRRAQKNIGELDAGSVLSQDGYISPIIIKKEIPEELCQKAAINPTQYKVKGSVGNGYMPEVPHICIFDISITTSAQHGYYIVYLFDIGNRQVHLSLNQGYTEYQQQYGHKTGKMKVLQNAIIAQKKLRSIDGFKFGALQLSGNGELAEGYKRGNICNKTYSLSELPQDDELIDDVRNLIGIYRELKGLVGNSIFYIESTLSESEFQEEVQNSPNIILPTGPLPKTEKRDVIKGGKSSVRDPKMSAQALAAANYSCENEPTHETFIAKSGRNFMEAHHLVPLEFEDDFKFRLDCPENILSLCPNCHRAFHHSNNKTRDDLIKRFYNERISSLQSRGIGIDIDLLKKYYRLVQDEQLVDYSA